MIRGRTAPCDEGVIASVAPVAGCAEQAKPWILAATILGSSMGFIDGAAVNVALPVLQTDLAVSLTAVQWVVNAYTLVSAALTLIGGSAGDRFGRRRIFMMGVVVFALASIACGLASSGAALIVARVVQGFGSTLMIPNSLAIIGASFGIDERGKAIGTWAAVTAGVGAFAPVLGGWLIDTISWRAIFFVNLPVACLTLALSWRYVPSGTGLGATAPLDWRGAALAATGLGLAAFGLVQAGDLGWHHPAVYGSLLVGAVMLTAFIAVEARGAVPMMPLGLFRSRAFSGINLQTLFLYGALGGALFFVPFNLIRLQGYSAALTGAAFLPLPLLMAALSRWSGGLLDRLGARLPLTAGPVVVAAGLALFARAGIGGSYWTDFFPPMVLLGLGMAVSVAPLTTTVMTAVEPRHTGVASGVNNAVADVANLLAVALFGVIALSTFGYALDGDVAGLGLPPDAASALAQAKMALGAAALPDAITGEVRAALATAIADSFLASFRVLMLVAAGLALLAALCAAVTMEPRGRDHVRALRETGSVR
jgi:EmrB/QacA subfamily drug resistance transporter